MSRDPLPHIHLGEVRRLGFPLITVCGLCNHAPWTCDEPQRVGFKTFSVAVHGRLLIGP
jgi:hypothetical protein